MVSLRLLVGNTYSWTFFKHKLKSYFEGKNNLYKSYKWYYFDGTHI